MNWIRRVLGKSTKRAIPGRKTATEVEPSEIPKPLLTFLDQMRRDPANSTKWISEADEQGIRVHIGPNSELPTARNRIERQLSMVGPDGAIHIAKIRYDPVMRPPGLEIVDAPIGSGAYSKTDLWWSLMEFRKQIEPAGWRVLCNGARRYVWSSGMAADFTNGESGYLLDRSPVGERRSEIVNVFDPAPIETVTNIREQIATVDEVFGGGLAEKLQSWMID